MVTIANEILSSMTKQPFTLHTLYNLKRYILIQWKSLVQHFHCRWWKNLPCYDCERSVAIHMGSGVPELCEEWNTHPTIWIATLRSQWRVM